MKRYTENKTYGIATDRPPIWANIGSFINISSVDAFGAVSLKSMCSKVPFGDRINMKPPLVNHKKINFYVTNVPRMK